MPVEGSKTDCVIESNVQVTENESVESLGRADAESSTKHDTHFEKDTITPVGSLKICLSYWEEANVNAHIKDVIVQGYKIPFRTLPDSVQLRNNKSARDNPSFVKEEIQKLLGKGCISRVQIKPIFFNPLTVAYSKTGKARLVLDCRTINKHLMQVKFKYEDVSIAKQLFALGDYVFTFDLRSAYHHINIFEAHRTYLGFSWEEQETKYYHFNVLPFGIATAAYIFTKLTRVVLAYWRAEAYKVVMFLDDGIGGSSTEAQACALSELVQISLKQFGFLIAEDKCNWKPTQKRFGWVLFGILVQVICTQHQTESIGYRSH